MFVSLLSHIWLNSFFSPTPALSTISRPLSSSMCSITSETANVGSSYNRMRGPGIGCWFSDRSNCSHWSFEATVLSINPNIYTDQWEPIVIYHSIRFTVNLFEPTWSDPEAVQNLLANGRAAFWWNIFRVTGALWRESFYTGKWRGSLLFSAPEQTVEQTIETLVI